MTTFTYKNPYLVVDYQCLVQDGVITGPAITVVESLFGGFGFASRRDRFANSIGPGGVVFIFPTARSTSLVECGNVLRKAFGNWVDDADLQFTDDHQAFVYEQFQIKKRRPPVFAMVKTGRGQHWAPYSNVIQYGNKTRG